MDAAAQPCADSLQTLDMVSVTKHCGGLATKPGFDFRRLNWPLLRANKASPVLSLFGTLIVHDKHVSHQDLNMSFWRHEGACQRVRGTQKPPSYMLCLSTLEECSALSFWVQALPFIGVQQTISVHSLSNGNNMNVAADSSGKIILKHDLWPLNRLSKEPLWSANLSGAHSLLHTRSWLTFSLFGMNVQQPFKHWATYHNKWLCVQ